MRTQRILITVGILLAAVIVGVGLGQMTPDPANIETTNQEMSRKDQRAICPYMRAGLGITKDVPVGYADAYGASSDQIVAYVTKCNWFHSRHP